MTFFAKVSNFVKYVLKNLPKEQNTLFFAKSSNFAKFGHTARSSRILSQLNFKLKIHFSLFSFLEQAIPFEYGAKFFDTSNAKTRFLSFEECLLRSLFWTTWSFLRVELVFVQNFECTLAFFYSIVQIFIAGNGQIMSKLI